MPPARPAFKSSSKGRAAPQPPPRALRGASTQELSLVAAFDDLSRNSRVLQDGSTEKEFLRFVKLCQDWKKRWIHAEMERQRLSTLVKEKENEVQSKDYKIKQARNLVEEERRGRQHAEADRDAFCKQLEMLKDILLNGGGKGGLDNETLERVRHIDTTTRRHNSPFKGQGDLLAAVGEESVESILGVSDLSFDDTADLLGESRRLSKRRSSGRFEQAQKRRKSRSLGKILDHTSDHVLQATTKMTVDQDGNAHAEAILETIPVAQINVSGMKDLRKAARKSRESRGERRVTYNERSLRKEYEPSAPPAHDGPDCWQAAAAGGCPPHRTPGPPQPVLQGSPNPGMIKRHFSNASSIPNRPHFFMQKKATVADRCGVCMARVGFRKQVLKCRDCGAMCHIDCRAKVPVPCVAASNRTPSKSHGQTLADFTPFAPPMIPAILIHCIREIETRGLEEVGIYRVPGNESEANEVLDKFMRSKAGAPIINKYEVPVIASAIKKFLRSLKEPIIPLSLWHQFVDAANNPDTTDGDAAIYQAISELPRPNRDTLAFLMLHLQKVAESPDCKMPVDNLAMVMGPTIVGYSSTDPAAIMTETELQKRVMGRLITLDADYWSSFVQVESEHLFTRFATPESAQKYGGGSATTPMQSAIARRTRSRLHTNPPKYFQSPMLF